MILLGDSAKVLKDFDYNCIDLTVTSPPYDQLRYYDGHSRIDIVTIAKELYRVTKRGGVCVWVVGDQTLDFNESLTSLEHAQQFKKAGWKLHDTMIYAKIGNNSNTRPDHKRYVQNWEYMFIFCKGTVRKFYPICDHKNKYDGHKYHSHFRRKKFDKQFYVREKRTTKEYSMRSNIWYYQTGYFKATLDVIAYKHPAIFPEALAHDHILSWSKERDYVLDPFLGSGTTYKMALALNRIPIGIEKNPKYITLAKKRLHRYLEQKKEFGKLL